MDTAEPKKVKCADCGFLAARAQQTGETFYVPLFTRKTGQLVKSISRTDIECPVCIMEAADLQEELNRVGIGVAGVLPVIREPRQCDEFYQFQQPFSPKEHVLMRQTEFLQREIEKRRLADEERAEARRQADLKWQAEQQEADQKWQEQQREADLTRQEKRRDADLARQAASKAEDRKWQTDQKWQDRGYQALIGVVAFAIGLYIHSIIDRPKEKEAGGSVADKAPASPSTLPGPRVGTGK